MNIVVKSLSTPPPGGLAALDQVELTPRNEEWLKAVAASSQGTPVWRKRKHAEARQLLALGQVAARMQVEYLDLREALRAVIFLRTPVPGKPDGKGELTIVREAVLGITYTQEALSKPQPGYSFVQILAPAGVWHPNVVPQPPPMGQPLCLGPQLPAGIRVKELVLMSYGALTMQAFKIEVMEAVGVFNIEAARWFDENFARLPLSRVPFLGTEDLETERKG